MQADKAEPQPISMIKTKSQTSQPSTKRHTRRNSRLITTDPEPIPISTTSSILTPPPSSGAMDIEEEETETEATRTTRSGKAFGVWQSRRKRLRQEAMDDPDMDVGSEEEEEAESDEEEQDSFEAGQSLLKGWRIWLTTQISIFPMRRSHRLPDCYVTSWSRCVRLGESRLGVRNLSWLKLCLNGYVFTLRV